jgi:hypothetical protein
VSLNLRAGGVYGSGNFTMSGGSISGNTATYSGGGVFFYNNPTFTKTGGIIYGDAPADTTTAQNSGPT